MTSTHADAIIIGAGMGGLSSAITLAAQGRDVLVIEAMTHTGGKVGVSSAEGVSFDTGPSLMTMIDVLSDLVTLSGESFASCFDLVIPSPCFRYLWRDGARLDVFHPLDQTRESVRTSFGPRALKEFDRFMAYASSIWEAARPNFIEGGAPSVTAVVKLGLTKMGQVAKIDPFRTMAQGIARYIKEPHLRDVMWRYATYNGSNPLRAPATLNCIAHVEMAQGGYGIAGGMAQIPIQLERLARQMGVRFRLGAAVTRIETGARGEVTAVVVDTQDRYETHIVIANADVSHVTTHLLDASVDHGLPQRVEPSMSGWNAVYRAAPSPIRAAHTVLFPKDYTREFSDIFDKGAPPTDPTVYLCDQNLSHKREGWEDGTRPLFVMANAPPEPEGGESDAADFTSLEERVIKRLQTHDLISTTDRIVWRRTPSDLARLFEGSRGSIYGAASNSPLAAFRRPSNRVDDVPGLYLASGSAHPGGGVPLCLISGRTAAHLALNHFDTR